MIYPDPAEVDQNPESNPRGKRTDPDPTVKKNRIRIPPSKTNFGFDIFEKGQILRPFSF